MVLVVVRLVGCLVEVIDVGGCVTFPRHEVGAGEIGLYYSVPTLGAGYSFSRILALHQDA